MAARSPYRMSNGAIGPAGDSYAGVVNLSSATSAQTDSGPGR